MKVKSRTSTTHTLTDDEGNEFELTHEPIPYSDQIVKYSNEGTRAVVGYLSHDFDPTNPREEHHNAGTMVCWHTRYSLGDEHSYRDPEDFLRSLANEIDPTVEDRIWYWESGRGWEILVNKYEDYHQRNEAIDERVNNIINKAVDQCVILDLYMYDHSGITISTGPFSCRWDSGPVGFLYMTPEQIKKEFHVKRITKEVKKRAKEQLEGEVETYDQYLRGEVYGIIYEKFVKNGDAWERDESYGLIGYQGDGTPIHGDTGYDTCWGFFGEDYAEQELKDGMDYHAEQINRPYVDPNQLHLEV